MARSPGRGRLKRVASSGGTVYVGDYVDVDGVRRRRHLAHDRETADRALTKLVRDRDLARVGLDREIGYDLSVCEVVERYLADLEVRARPRVHAEAASALRRMCAEIGATTLRGLTKLRVVDWRIARCRAGAANKTVNNQVNVLHAALNYAIELDQLVASPLAGLRSLPVTQPHRRRLPRAATLDEAERLLRAAHALDAKKPDRPRRAPLVLFLLATGARWSEAIAARWTDFEPGCVAVTLRGETTKSGKTRSIPLVGRLRDELVKLRAEAVARGGAPGAKVFEYRDGEPWTSGGRVQFRRHLHAIMKAAKIEPRDAAGRVLHTHALRHTFATMLARAGTSRAATKAMMGHSTVTLTDDVYTHVAAADARACIRALEAQIPTQNGTDVPKSTERETT